MPAAREKRLELSAELAESGNVLGDEDRLEQVFNNLLSNAIEFTPDGGAISLRCASYEGQLEIRVEDSGEGIVPEFISKVFERFSEADPTIARRHSGLGLGLAIARTLVGLHGRAIQAASPDVGHGSSIPVRLPLAPEPLHAVEMDDTHGSPIAPPDLEKLDVLLVEDHADLLEALAMTFEAAGARVRSARSAAEALAAFGEQLPDVVISDIAMPDPRRTLPGQRESQAARPRDSRYRTRLPCQRPRAIGDDGRRLRCMRKQAGCSTEAHRIGGCARTKTAALGRIALRSPCPNPRR